MFTDKAISDNSRSWERKIILSQPDNQLFILWNLGPLATPMAKKHPFIFPIPIYLQISTRRLWLSFPTFPYHHLISAECWLLIVPVFLNIEILFLKTKTVLVSHRYGQPNPRNSTIVGCWKEGCGKSCWS